MTARELRELLEKLSDLDTMPVVVWTGLQRYKVAQAVILTAVPAETAEMYDGVGPKGGGDDPARHRLVLLFE